VRKTKILLFIILLVGAGIYFSNRGQNTSEQSGAPPVEDDADQPEDVSLFSTLFNPDWKRPEGPLRVGLQAGHWKNGELPDELENLRLYGGGATSPGGTPEWEVVLAIAEEAKKILEPKGIVVDILPATIPQNYWADAFVSIHADGNDDASVSGFKVAGPWRDFSGKSEELVQLLEEEYDKATNMRIDTNITNNMRGYYGFAWWRYEHSVHPMTPSAIIESGFLTNTQDARFLILQPEVPARAIAAAILKFLDKS